MANTQKIKICDNQILLPSQMGKGYIKAYELHDGMHCLVSDFYLKEDFHLHKFPLSREFFILRIDKVLHSDNSIWVVERKLNSELNSKKYSFIFLSSLMDFVFIAPKKSHVKSLEISIPRQWLYKKLGMQEAAERLTTYLHFKNSKSLIDFITPGFIEQFNNILNGSWQPFDASLELEINSLIDKFISNLSLRLRESDNEKKIKIVSDEIKRLLDVGNYLIKDLSVAPTFSSLQQVAAMSGTTLKTKFKRMYGVTLYEYFQQMRMEKARLLLLSFKYTITDVGHQLGYVNLSNFSVAFKKEFGHLPGKFVQLHKDMSNTKSRNNSASI
ncbi:MAG: AraC family transcriptional regulator [Ginsengibacter sp.]